MTTAALRAVEEADYVIGSHRLLELIPFTQAEKQNAGPDISGTLDYIEKNHERGKVAVLVSGDPGLHSLGRPVVKRFGAGACRVIPGVSSVQAGFAAVGIDWNDAVIISAHAENPDEGVDRAHGASKIAVLLGRTEAIGWVARFAEKLSGQWRVFVCENLTLATERIREMDVAAMKNISADPISVVLLVKEEV